MARTSTTLWAERGPIGHELVLEAPAALIETLGAGSALPGLGVGRPRASRGRSVYYDTAEADLARAGFTLAVYAEGDVFAQLLELREDAPIARLSTVRAWRVRLASPEPDLAWHGRRAFAQRGLPRLEAPIIPRLEIDSTRAKRRIVLGDAVLGATFESGERRLDGRADGVGRVSLRSRGPLPPPCFAPPGSSSRVSPRCDRRGATPRELWSPRGRERRASSRSARRRT